MSQTRRTILAASLLGALTACASPGPSAPAPAPRPGGGAPTGGAAGQGQQPQAQQGPQGGARQGEPRAYRQVITDRAVTQSGLLKVHRIGERMYFEIPASVLRRELLLISRHVESTLQNPAGFFGGGSRNIVQWERQGNRVVLRGKEHDLMADTTSAIWRQVSGFRNGPVLASFNVEAYGPDSAAVVDATDLFLSNIPELGPVDGLVRNKS